MNLLMESFIRSVRICSGSFYLLFILISIPIAFNIGGLYCGLSFTVTLFNLYFISTTLHFIAKKWANKFFIFLSFILYYCQHLIIASLLYLFLSGFSNNDDFQTMIRESTKPTESNWIMYYYYYKFFVKPWQISLSFCSPFFTMSEGFFTILAIQAIGETNKWLSNEKKSNTWIISSLLASGGVITTSLYYLYRIYVTPIWDLSIQTASLLGFVLSLVGSLGIYGIVSERGSVVESSLFFAYIVRCIYELSPQLATSATDEIFAMFREVWQARQNSFQIKDDLIFYYGGNIVNNVQLLWKSFKVKTLASPYYLNFTFFSFANIKIVCQPIWNFFKNFTVTVPSSITQLFWIIFDMASESVSPAVVINLCFRILIFYSATRIIPALQRKNSRERRRSRRFMRLLYWYSPCVLIAMYTHLILQYSGESKNDMCIWGCNSKWIPTSFRKPQDEQIVVNSWEFWNWCNIFWTILIYSNELIGNNTPSNGNEL